MNSNENKGIMTRTVNLKSRFLDVNHRKRYPGHCTYGGTFSDFELSWLYNGPVLTIVNNTDGTILSSWNFSSVTNDNETEISSVIEYPFIEHTGRLSTKENQLYFIVSYISRKNSNCISFISICHPRTSQILHTITTKVEVTCLSLIAPRKDHASPISGIVKYMCGALAVGTKNGSLLIVDIKEIFSCVRRSACDKPLSQVRSMEVLDLKRYSESSIKEKISKADEMHHVAVSLSVTDKKDAHDNELEISALMYVPQCTMLAVGLRSGVFQLWDICSLKKLHKSSQLVIPTPVVKFGFQEPCNDPQSFCYLWVLHESDSEKHSCIPFAVMYACLFKKVISVSDYGRHYKNFMHCKKRFDLDVDMERCLYGRCVACHVVSNTPSNLLRHVTSNEEDPSKINLFVVAFETWEHDTELSSYITLVVFDMNQWYKAQLPHQIYHGYSVPFISFQTLDCVSDRKCSVLDMRIKKDTIQQFLSFNLSEEYSYPSSLSFDTIFLTESKIVQLRILGAQHNVLEKIIAEGPSGIINPNKYFSECREAGLRPYFSDSYGHLTVPTQLQQRNYILTILLEHKMSSYLVRCVKEWADGSRSISGCTLPNFIQWAWDCVIRIKQLTDSICIPLFDYSGDDLDRENYQKLKHCCQLMHIIRDLLGFIVKHYRPYLMDDTKVRHQLDTLQLVTKYFDVIIWCLDCSLLPEKVASSSDKCVPIYMMNLMQYTEQRREELKNIKMKDEYFFTENINIYIIDSILESEKCGKKMRLQWERESSGMTCGLYPPVTIQSLLRMFLMPDLSIGAKHFIMIYFLLDVCDYHRDEDMKEQLLSFPIVFSIDISFFSLVQACWFVDHEKFEEATDLLVMNSVITHLKNRRDLYRTLILSCVCQRQYAMALRCERLTKLSFSVFKNNKFYITLLLLNGLVLEAYTTLKTCSFDQLELLKHFFEVCDGLGYLKEVFKFPLTMEEEEVFISYLDKSGNRDAGDLKVMYLLSRARYVEAIDVNHKLSLVAPKHTVVGNDTTVKKPGVGRTTTRDLLVNAFSKTLPNVTNDLINFCRKEKNKIRFSQVVKPTPLSVVVHTDTSQQIPMYKSSFESVMQAAISKTAETWANFPETFKNKRTTLNIRNTPFLRSDIMTPRKNNLSSLLRGKEVGSKVEMENSDEPAKKRPRISINNTQDSFSELTDNKASLTLSADVTKILCTPHIQKRLNKLLQNTPDASPLTSILKSSELPRLRQPQKVGFNVPEVESKSSQIVNSDNKTLPAERNKSIEIHMGKSVIDNFKRSPSPKESVIRYRIEECIPLNDSLNTSQANDSYYSLDSDTDSPNITDFIVEPTSRNSTKKSMIIESMSEEEMTTEASSRLIIESMSDEEMFEQVHQSQVERDRKPTCQPTSVIEKRQVEQPSQTQIEVHMEPMREESNVELPFEAQTDVYAETDYKLDETAFSLHISNVRSLPSEEVLPAESLSLPISNEDMAPTFVNSDDATFTSLQPVLFAAPLESLPTPEQSRTSDESSESDTEIEAKTTKSLYFNETEEPKITEPSYQENLSQNVHENNIVLKLNTVETAKPSTENSVVLVRGESSADESDSDIEIVENSSIQLPEKDVLKEQMDDATTEENDNMSEGTYESEYSYSNESAEEDNFVEEELEEEEQLQQKEEQQQRKEGEEEEDETTDEVINEIEEEGEEECEEGAEEEDEEEGEEVEEDDDDDEDVYDNEGKQEFEEQEEEYVDEKEECAAESDEKMFEEHNAEIDYDELKKIMSTVAHVESKKENKLLDELQDSGLPVVSSSFSCSANASVCEVFDINMSVIEETVTVSSLHNIHQTDIEEHSTKMETEEPSKEQGNCLNINYEFKQEEQPLIETNSQRAEDTSIEVLSVSCVEKDKTSNEPPLVFYFGENSVASIGEELLNDDSPKHNSSKNEDKMKSEMMFENDVATCKDHNEKENVAVKSNDVFEEQSYLTATQPECSAHYIEKIDSVTDQMIGINSMVSDKKETEETVYIQFEAEEVCDYEFTKNDSRPSNDTSEMVGALEQPEDLTQPDMVARERTYHEAKEANRLAEVGKRKSENRITDNGCVFPDEEVISATYSTAPDTAPLNLVMPTTLPICEDDDGKSTISSQWPESVRADEQSAETTKKLCVEDLPQVVETTERSVVKDMSYIETKEKLAVKNLILVETTENSVAEDLSPAAALNCSVSPKAKSQSTVSSTEAVRQEVFHNLSASTKNYTPPPSLAQISSSDNQVPDIDILPSVDRSQTLSMTSGTTEAIVNTHVSPVPLAEPYCEATFSDTHGISIPVVSDSSKEKKNIVSNESDRYADVVISSSPEGSPIKSSDTSEQIIVSSTSKVSLRKLPGRFVSLRESSNLEERLTKSDVSKPEANLSNSPVSKADSVSSITFSLPDSPGPQNLDLPNTPPQQMLSCEPALPRSRRSERIASRRSIESIPDTVSVDSPSGKSRTSRRRSVGSSVAKEDDDAMSVRSGFSMTESVASRTSSVASGKSAASNQSQKRKRSYSHLEMRKSSVRPQFRPLEVILSDEELTSPARSDILPLHRNSASRKPKYAASEPDIRRTKKKSNGDYMNEDDEKQSSVSEDTDGVKLKRMSKRNLLNPTVMHSSSPVRKHELKKFFSSTPLRMQKQTTTEHSESRSEIRDYADSRRLTRYQRSLLEYGIKRFGKSDQSVLTEVGNDLEDIIEETKKYSNTEADNEDLPENDSQSQSTSRSLKQSKTRTRSSSSKQSKNTSDIITSSSRGSKVSKRDSKKPTVHPVDTRSDSSDESISSRASTSSKRSKGRRSSYTSLELRRSSTRPQFRPLTVIQSDESLTVTPKKSAADDDSILSSADNSHSKRSHMRRVTRSQKTENEHSDRESSVSDIGNLSTSVITRQARRSLTLDETPTKVLTEKRQAKSPVSSEKQVRSSKRSAKIQKLEEISKKTPERSSKRKK